MDTYEEMSREGYEAKRDAGAPSCHKCCQSENRQRCSVAPARSQALVDGFANRWLGLSKLTGIVPDTDLYREFDESLRDAMAKETQLFVASQLEGDRSITELLTAGYTLTIRFSADSEQSNPISQLQSNQHVEAGRLTSTPSGSESVPSSAQSHGWKKPRGAREHGQFIDARFGATECLGVGLQRA